MSGAFTRYRVLAYVVGTGLLILVFVAVPLKYLADTPGPAAVVGTAHGFLYIVYVLSVLDLAWRARWGLVRTLAVVLAGTIPFLSFVAERRVSRQLAGTPES